MICHVGLASEFRNCFKKKIQKRLYGGIWNRIDGLSIKKVGQAWIFIDRIAPYGLSGRHDVVEEITNTVIHELLHLCGVRDESATRFGTELVK
jgi:hypothetical protein